MFVHLNPDLRRWWRGRFLERVAAEGRAQGKYDWLVYCEHVNFLAQGCGERPGEEWLT